MSGRGAAARWSVLMRTAAIMAALGAASGEAVRAQQKEPVIRPRSVAEELQMFSQVLNQIRINHADSVDVHELFMAAIEGMVAAVDPHSYVLPALRLSPDKDKMLRDGKAHPVPLTFTYIGAAPVVVSTPRTAAATSLDVLPGDELVAIDGAPVSARSAEELHITLAGPKGSTVMLTFERHRLDGSSVTLTRAVRRVQADETSGVPVAFLLAANTGYVRITHFLNERVADDLRSALSTLEREGMRRLVLDLRDNGGGDPDQAAKIAGEFLPRGSVVYRSVGRRADSERTVTVERSWLRPGERAYPVVVLVDRGTASAAELLAGALQDHDRAIIVGRPTFGKALLMQPFPLSDGSVIMLVTGSVQTPCGRVIQRQYRGLAPREYYRMAAADRDTAGLPSCRTANGRLVYGGDGIRPDILLPAWQPPPLWLAHALENDLILRWTGSYLDAAPLPDLLAVSGRPALPAATTLEFRTFAAQQGVEIPTDSDTELRLHAVLLSAIAAASRDAAGYYRIAAALDAELEAAVAAFAQTDSVLGRQK